MKIEKFSVSVAVKDGMAYTEVLHRLKAAIAGACRTKADMSVDCDCGIYAIEFERSDGKAQPEANEEPRQKRKYTRKANDPAKEEPRQKRKYTRRAKDTAAGGEEIVKEGATPIRRVKLEGKMVEMRGNCQGGNAKSQEV